MSDATNPGLRWRASSVTSAPVGLNGAPGNGPKPVSRMVAVIVQTKPGSSGVPGLDTHALQRQQTFLGEDSAGGGEAPDAMAFGQYAVARNDDRNGVARKRNSDRAGSFR